MYSKSESLGKASKSRVTPPLDPLEVSYSPDFMLGPQRSRYCRSVKQAEGEVGNPPSTPKFEVEALRRQVGRHRKINPRRTSGSCV